MNGANVGLESANYHVDVLAVPQRGRDRHRQEGRFIEDGILPYEVWDALLNEIDQQCKTEDAKRGQAAKKETRRR